MQLYLRVYHLSTVTANHVQLNAGGYYVEQLGELVQVRDTVRYSFLALISHISITAFNDIFHLALLFKFNTDMPQTLADVPSR